MQNTRLLPSVALLLTICVGSTTAAELAVLLETLRSVGPRAAGNRQATGAWQELARADAAALPVMLAALDGSNPLAANYIRTAVDAVAERTLARGGQLPAAELERFLLDTGHDPRARRLAYEWLLRVDSSAAGHLIPRMLNDPSLEMRRDAVTRLIEEADARKQAGDDARATATYRQALSGARDLDQIKQLAEVLRRAGAAVDLPRHFGFLVDWHVVGPFDNTAKKGYDVAYPPEKAIDLRASYQGKHGKVAWVEHVTDDDFGSVDFNRVLGEEKGVVAYATCVFVAPTGQEVEFRLTSFNAVKLWLNGKLIDEHHVYHSGSQMDQYVCRAALEPGRNVILAKVCQNEQTQSWADKWWFALRVCDEQGTAILSADRNK